MTDDLLEDDRQRAFVKLAGEGIDVGLVARYSLNFLKNLNYLIWNVACFGKVDTEILGNCGFCGL